MTTCRGAALAGVSIAAAVGAALAVPAGAADGKAPTFHHPSRADQPSLNGYNEPATVVGKDGTRYVAYQFGSQLSYTRDGGKHWTYVGGKNFKSLLARNVTGCTSADDIGDVDLTTDQAGRVYFADLQATINTAGNGVDTGVQPIVATSDDRFGHYKGTCAAHQPASVDREWMAAYTPRGKSASHSSVYLSYHDFSPLNTLWVTASHDGGQSWDQPVNAISGPIAAETSLCDTVPAGTAIDPRNGWVYVAWTAGSNAVDNAATGCNYTQGAVFNNFFVAVSKDGGKTFTDTLAFSAPDVTAATPSDMSEIFGSIATDRQGGVYITFPAFLQGEYAAYAAYSPPAGNNNTLHFAKPVQVSAASVNTAYFTRIAAGDRGRVDVIYLGSPVKNVSATATNKLTYNGSDPKQPDCTPEVTQATGVHGVRFLGKPCEMPDTAPWYLYLAQSLDLTSSTPRFTNVELRSDPVHTGDICTLGIFCLPGDDRDLADTNDIKIDATGGAQIAYSAESADRKKQEVDFQCQRGGPGLYAGVKVRDCQAPLSVRSGGPLTRKGANDKGTGTGRGAGGSLPSTGGLPLAVPGLVLISLASALAALRRRQPVLRRR
jgi:hypothetical protein